MRRAPVVASVSIALLLVAGAAGCSGDGSDNAANAEAPSRLVTVVSENLLHGTACAPESNRCDLPGRMTTFATELADAHCPPVVGAQETNTATVADLEPKLTTECGNYHVLWDGDPSLDRELVLTTLPVVGFRRFDLAGPLRTAMWARLRSGVGVLDFWTTHLASSSDDRPCDRRHAPAVLHRRHPQLVSGPAGRRAGETARPERFGDRDRW